LVAAALSLLAVWPSGRVSSQNPDAGLVLDRAVGAFQKVSTMRANFVQAVRDPMIGTDERSRGELMHQRPDRFTMRWTDPRGDLIVADGRTLWVYLPSTTPNQVVRSTIAGRQGESPDVVGEFLDRPRERFTYSYERAEAVGGRPADVLRLVPRDESAAYRRVLLWIDREDYLPRRVEITEASGSVRLITLERLRVNGSLPSWAFVFRPPPGVRVVDATH
jgi:outer membrane lipoprotein carrier protein